MNGGRYLTIFPDNEDRILRSLLYSLESFGIVKLTMEKEDKFSNYKWELTKKGKALVKSNRTLQDFLREKNYLKFCQEVKSLLERDK